jgi:hypothetical protein
MDEQETQLIKPDIALEKVANTSGMGMAWVGKRAEH